MTYLPVIISLFSLCISIFLAGWTVYKDAIRKPRFRVTLSLKSVYFHGRDPLGPDFYVEALNMGPLENRIGLVLADPGFFQSKFNYAKSAFIFADDKHIGTTAKSQRVAVGDRASFVFPINAHSWELMNYAYIGVSDGFGNMHWATKKNFQKVKMEILGILVEKKIPRAGK